MFLTDEEMVRLTGFSRKSKQIAQLKLMGVPFMTNASGHPVVSRATADSLGSKGKKSKPVDEWRPKWAEHQL